jgi:uncharacterized membrane protein YkoI
MSFANASVGPAGNSFDTSWSEMQDWSTATNRTIQIRTIQNTDFFQLSRDDGGKLRSRSEVVREIKKRYNAKVLKISLHKHQSIYRVRILLPNGKIRDIQVNARR